MKNQNITAILDFRLLGKPRPTFQRSLSKCGPPSVFGVQAADRGPEPQHPPHQGEVGGAHHHRQ